MLLEAEKDTQSVESYHDLMHALGAAIGGEVLSRSLAFPSQGAFHKGFIEGEYSH